MTVKAVVHEAEEGGLWAEVPSMPGCMTEGRSLDELVANLWEAIEGWTESRRVFDVDAQVVTAKSHDLELCILTSTPA